MADATFDFDDFVKQSELITKMGSFAGVAKMIPGIGGLIDTNKITQVEKRLKKNKAIIRNMTKKERANPDLFVKDRSSQSRLRRITAGSGTLYEEGVQFIGEFQKMRTMMSRMQKQMGGNPAMGEEEQAIPAGNRALRRAAKKKKKGGRAAARGFG